MTNQNKPGQPNNKKDLDQNPNKNNHNMHDRSDQTRTDKGLDQGKNRNPNDSKK